MFQYGGLIRFTSIEAADEETIDEPVLGIITDHCSSHVFLCVETHMESTKIRKWPDENGGEVWGCGYRWSSAIAHTQTTICGSCTQCAFQSYNTIRHRSINVFSIQCAMNAKNRQPGILYKSRSGFIIRLRLFFLAHPDTITPFYGCPRPGR